MTGPFGVVVAPAAAAVTGALLSLIARRLLRRFEAGWEAGDGRADRDSAGGPDDFEICDEPGGDPPSGRATDERT